MDSRGYVPVEWWEGTGWRGMGKWALTMTCSSIQVDHVQDAGYQSYPQGEWRPYKVWHTHIYILSLSHIQSHPFTRSPAHTLWLFFNSMCSFTYTFQHSCICTLSPRLRHICRLMIGEEEVYFNAALEYAGEELLGSYVDKWPLTKVLAVLI